jgi:hypothetical protein
MSSWVVGLGVVLLGLPGVALGQRLVHEPSGFAVSMDAAGLPACIILPEGRADPAACAGVDLATVSDRMRNPRQNVVGGGLLRVPDGDVIFVVTAAPVRNAGRLSKETLDMMVASSYPRAGLVMPPGSAGYSWYWGQGIPIVRVPLSGKQINYFIVGADTLHLLTLVAADDRGPELRKIGDLLAASATIAVPEIDGDVFGKAAEQVRMEALVELAVEGTLAVGGLLFTGLVVGVLVWASRRGAKRATSTPQRG